MNDSFEQLLTPAERARLAPLTSPAKIQAGIDELEYSADEFYRCPLRALRDGKAHCFDGALLAAALLRRIGFPPLILELLPDDRDDDHLLAVFKIDGYWGAVAKSNFVGLRYREPIHRTLRELALSYFEQYYNVAGEKTLRGYTVPLDLARLDHLHWTTRDERLESLAHQLDRVRRYWLLSEGMIASLAAVDERSRQAGLSGSVAAGLFKPPDS
jgi:hypothetical protein